MEIIRSSLLFCLLGIVPSAAAQSPATENTIPEINLGIPTLERETARAQTELTRYFDPTDLDDSLGLAWANRPYQRATLAIMQKTIRVLEREIELRKAGNGAIDDQTIRSMFYWLRNALNTIDKPAIRNHFYPDRYVLPDKQNGMGRIGFIDMATSTRWAPSWGDFEILMCTGLPVYAHGPSPWLADNTRTAMTLAIREWNKTPLFFKDDTQDSRFHTLGFEQPLQNASASTHRYAKARTRLWEKSFSKPGFLLIEGWRDLRDGSASAFPSLFTDPQMTETLCHTGLDMLYCLTRCPDLSSDTLAIVTPGKNTQSAAEQPKYLLLINTESAPKQLALPSGLNTGSIEFYDMLNDIQIAPDETGFAMEPYGIRLLTRTS